jgi:uncharacterized protein involved in tolerance to divalent cations
MSCEIGVLFFKLADLAMLLGKPRSGLAGRGALRDRIIGLHSYETPEIIALPIIDGAKPYLDWIQEQV